MSLTDGATYTLGIDVSTQSISAALIEVSSGGTSSSLMTEHSLAWRDDARLNRYGIAFDTVLIPARERGEADQPPLMFLAGLDALFSDMRDRGIALDTVSVIAVSAQQHGHVYLNRLGCEAMDALGAGAASGSPSPDLATRFADGFAYGTAPIWQTANSHRAAEEIRDHLGGPERVVELSGSNSPARFTGAVIRRTAMAHPAAWDQTTQVHLLSSFASGVLAGTSTCPIDWGNGSGMTLMDYRARRWSEPLLEAVGAGIAGGGAGIRSRLPKLAEPTETVGTIAGYFVSRYGFSRSCRVTAGSGDNPQTKVMADGDLLSLGTSIVYMVDSGEPFVDKHGFANSMYDGIGRPFVFACRTNGAMVWDQLRSRYGANLTRAEAALATASANLLGKNGVDRYNPVIWQPYAESYPASPPIAHQGCQTGTGDFDTLYPALVESALILTRHYAREFERSTAEPLALTGGPSQSPGIVARVAAIFERPIAVVPPSGAALGSALSAFAASRTGQQREIDLPALRASLAPARHVDPDTELVRRFRSVAPKIVEALELRVAAPEPGTSR